MRWIYGVGVLVVVAGVSAYFYVQHQLNAPIFTEERQQQIEAEVAAQNEEAFTRPARQPATYPPSNPLNNAYFGDLHSHSALSFDSYIFGNRLSVDEAYQIAKGNAFETASGERIQLSVPLDFAAVTDHAEGFGLFETCAGEDVSDDFMNLCRRFETPNASFFLDLREAGEKRPPENLGGSDDAIEGEQARSTWAQIVAAAERHNEPGRFTTFAAYEYSPPLPDRGKIHRNVIFRNDKVPARAISAFDALTEIDLWNMILADCEAPCDFITIPHNPNKSWGLAFASHTIDGDAYTEEDWKLRDAVEPLVEIFQIKGNSECSLGFGATDEECGFEQFLPPCAEGQVTQCIHPTSMARDGLKLGLKLEEELGFNPLDFGMIGSTDTHNSNPGNAEEYDFRGAAALFTGNANLRLRGLRGGRATTVQNPGGLAVVWAPANTRDALFDAMERKEVYATSGTRIRLRFFGGPSYKDGLLTEDNPIETAYQLGVPMGGMLRPSEGETPSFFVHALQDPLNAPLDRVQIIKGWIEDGDVKELVYDVACSDGRTADPDTRRCSTSQASVDLTNCAFDADKGAQLLQTVWQDPNYDAAQRAFYYARVVQNPTCRWSTYDALRLGEAPPEDLPSTSTEMAWSSPIWVGKQ
ncbi:DUF3604 domain-containing protein [Parvibaculaceae bacterium PLY_AMNH_Bact1]|nr:DUF3604 domain-containing protein [Parvibaculaceae bacterium PLY_AMNH_Bact1]